MESETKEVNIPTQDTVEWCGFRAAHMGIFTTASEGNETGGWNEESLGQNSMEMYGKDFTSLINANKTTIE